MPNVPALVIALGLAAVAVPADAAEWMEKRAASDYMIELRVAPRSKISETPFTVSLTRKDGTPVATARARGRATFSSAGLKGVATLHPDGENRMKGHGLMPDSADMRFEVSVTLPGEPAIEAVFASSRRRD